MRAKQWLGDYWRAAAARLSPLQAFFHNANMPGKLVLPGGGFALGMSAPTATVRALPPSFASAVKSRLVRLRCGVGSAQLLPLFDLGHFCDPTVQKQKNSESRLSSLLDN